MPTITAYVHAYIPTHNAGAETTLHDILKHLVLEGWEANVVIKPSNSFGFVAGPQYDINGVHVIPARNKKELVHYVANSDVTISHLECSERTHLLSMDWDKPSIHLVHNTHPLTVRWMQRASGLIINTEWISKEPGFDVWTKPKMILNPPVDPDDYKTTRGKSVTLVNLWEDKGAALFYELARRMPDVPFLGVRGGYGIQEIVDLPNVSIMDHTSDMKSVYGETKVILMPSKYESFGRVGVEAMASGIPTLAEPTPGLQESLGDSGIFNPREDVAAWAKSLRDVLKPARYGKQSKLAFARSKELASQREQQLFTMKMFVNEIARNGKI